MSESITINAVPVAVKGPRRHASFEAAGEAMGLLAAAYYLQMHPSYVRNLVVGGVIEATKSGKNWVVTKAACDAYRAGKAAGKVTGVPGAKAVYTYVPAAVASLKRAIKMVSTAAIDPEAQTIVGAVLNDLLAAAIAEWMAKKDELAEVAVEAEA